MKSVLLLLALSVIAAVSLIALVLWVLPVPQEDPARADREHRYLTGEWMEINPLPDGTPCWERVLMVNSRGDAEIAVVCRGEP